MKKRELEEILGAGLESKIPVETSLESLKVCRSQETRRREGNFSDKS